MQKAINPSHSTFYLIKGEIHLWELPVKQDHFQQENSQHKAQSSYLSNFSLLTPFSSLTILNFLANSYYSTYCPPHTQKLKAHQSSRGKPFFPESLLHVSHTHTETRRIVGFTLNSTLGLDIENYNRSISSEQIEKLTRRFFSTTEAQKISRKVAKLKAHIKPANTSKTQTNNLREHFFKLWTTKEAYAKAMDIPLFQAMKIPCSTMPPQVSLSYPITPDKQFTVAVACTQDKKHSPRISLEFTPPPSQIPPTIKWFQTTSLDLDLDCITIA